MLDRAEGISSHQYHEGLFVALREQDGQVFELINREYDRLQNSLQLIAAENLCSRQVLAALGSIVQNKTTEGFPGARCHGGCDVVDDIERLAVARAKEAFKAKYANIQPHSGTTANQIVIVATLNKGDRILGLGLEQGGHYSHGADVSFTGTFFDAASYNVDMDTFIFDYEAIRTQAKAFKPKMIVCGASAYSRTIDFRKFRQIADEVGAYLLADISHLASLVLAGAHPSPIEYAHFTTTSTYKPGGPRGGLILMGRDYNCKIKVQDRQVELWEQIEATTFPGLQGTPYLNNAAAKAVFFRETLSEEYKSRQFKVVENAKRLADRLVALGYNVLTGGTDNHMVLVNVAGLRNGMTGAIAHKCLEDCGIVINKIRLPYDGRYPAVTSGIRLGTPIVTRNGMGVEQMDVIAGLIDIVLKGVRIKSETEYELDESLRNQTVEKVRKLCREFPLR